MKDDRHANEREPKPEMPRFEPEIIPPTHDGKRPDGWSGAEKIYVRQATFRAPGPLSIILVLLAVGLIASVILLLLVGFVLVWVPVVAFALAALIFAGVVRNYWWRLRGRPPGTMRSKFTSWRRPR
jgi:hypothetical protein